MDLQLKNKVALVAGSSRGIGRSIAEALLCEGCRVCVTGRNEADLDSTASALRHRWHADNVYAIAGDLTDLAVIEQVLGALTSQWGAIDCLVANVGTGSGKPGWEQEDSEWERLFRLNFLGSVRLAQAAIPEMRRNGGSILFISSIVGVEATAAPLPYSAAKAALLNYSKNLARMVAQDGIRVNSIAPGNVLFPGGTWERHLANRREAVEEYIATEVPVKRFGRPEEVASLAVYLCSGVSGFVTGGCYIVDGGQTRRI